MSPAPTIRLASDSASNRPSAKSQARAWREGRDMGAACAVATGGLNALRSCAGEGIRQLLDIGLQCARPGVGQGVPVGCIQIDHLLAAPGLGGAHQRVVQQLLGGLAILADGHVAVDDEQDRKSTRLNSSHSQISYAVFCLKKKKKN